MKHIFFMFFFQGKCKAIMVSPHSPASIGNLLRLIYLRTAAKWIYLDLCHIKQQYVRHSIISFFSPFSPSKSFVFKKFCSQAAENSVQTVPILRHTKQVSPTRWRVSDMGSSKVQPNVHARHILCLYCSYRNLIFSGWGLVNMLLLFFFFSKLPCD